MLVDLERNDLGRICAAAPCEVDEFMTIETYAHVHHIVSNVRGVLREDVTPGRGDRAVFPGGTITGCPKVRCMQLLAELEGEPRDAYTGSLGYLDLDGSMRPQHPDPHADRARRRDSSSAPAPASWQTPYPEANWPRPAPRRVESLRALGDMSDDRSQVLVNGVDGGSVSADDRGLQYGDGLFETIMVRERPRCASRRAPGAAGRRLSPARHRRRRRSTCIGTRAGARSKASVPLSSSR